MKLRFSPRLVITFAGIAALAACGQPKYSKVYVLNLPPAATSIPPASVIRGAVAVHEFECPQYLCEGRIVYRTSAEEIGFYEFHRWAMNPRWMITQFVAERVRSGALFSSVSLQEPGAEPAYVLKGTIERLEEVDQGRDVRAVCIISAQLVDTRTKSIVWSHSESQTVPVQNRNIAGVVSSLSAAVRMTVDNLVKSLEEKRTVLSSASTAEP
jgi:ABC-type uncharacterized transport system auxiliary subunit